MTGLLIVGSVSFVPTSTSEQVTRTIRAELARRDKTQGDLAEALGLHPDTISKRMTGQVRWSVDELRATADFLGLPLTALLEDDLARPSGGGPGIRPI